MSGDTVWVERSSGEYTKGTVVYHNPESHKITVDVSDNQDVSKLKGVEFNEISRTAPTEEMKRAARERAARKNDEASSNSRNNRNGYASSGPRQSDFQRDSAKYNQIKPEWDHSPAWQEFMGRFVKQENNLRRLYQIREQVATSGSTPELKDEAKQIYRQLSSTFHTDRYQNLPDDAKAYMTDRFQEMKQQYDAIAPRPNGEASP